MPKVTTEKVTAQLVEINALLVELPCAFCSECVSTWPISVECTDRGGAKAAERMVRREAAKRGETAHCIGRRSRATSDRWLSEYKCRNLAAGYAINWLAGTSDLPHSRFQFDLGQPEFGFKIINRKRKEPCTCGKIIGHGDQADAAITKPPHWPRPLKLSLLRPLAR